MMRCSLYLGLKVAVLGASIAKHEGIFTSRCKASAYRVSL